MKVRLLALPLILSACVQAPRQDEEFIGGVLAGSEVVIDGTTLVAEQMRDWPKMIPQVDANGNTTIVQSGTADTVVISGSAEDRDLAIRALAEFCNGDFGPDGFDTQYVFKDPKTGDWWFDGFCG